MSTRTDSPPNVAAKASATAVAAVGREYSCLREERHHRLLLPTIETLLADVPRGARVLDLGCGTGYVSGRLLARGYDVTGIDVSESGVALARQALPQGHFHCLGVGDVELEARLGGKFAAIVSVEVVEHLYSPAQWADACYNLLNDHGTLIVTTPYHGYLKNVLLALAGRMDGHYQPLSEGGHIKFWSRGTLTRLLERHGFRVVAFRGRGRFPGLWKSMILKAIKT